MMSDYNYKDVYEQWVNNPLFGQKGFMPHYLREIHFSFIP